MTQAVMGVFTGRLLDRWLIRVNDSSVRGYERPEFAVLGGAGSRSTRQSRTAMASLRSARVTHSHEVGEEAYSKTLRMLNISHRPQVSHGRGALCPFA